MSESERQGSAEFHAVLDSIEAQMCPAWGRVMLTRDAGQAVWHVNRAVLNFDALVNDIGAGWWPWRIGAVLPGLLVAAWSYAQDHRGEAATWAAANGVETPLSPALVFGAVRGIHATKSAGYGREADPFRNFRRSTRLGIEPWRGALLRASDKVSRLDNWLETGRLAGEGVLDALYDLASYLIIASVLYREETAAAVSLP